MANAGLPELHRLLRDELAHRFTAQGWAIDVAEHTEPGQILVAAFRRAIATDFSITAHFRSNEWGSPRETELAIKGAVGVSFEPAYRLWPVVWTEEIWELGVPLSRFRSRSGSWDVWLPGPSDVGSVAEALVTPIFEQGIEWASQYTSVEALLEANRGENRRHFLVESKVVPVILAGAGRLEEARDSLDAYLASGREEVRTAEYQDFVNRLNSWIDAGGVLPDAPTKPVKERYVREASAWLH